MTPPVNNLPIHTTVPASSPDIEREGDAAAAAVHKDVEAVIGSTKEVTKKPALSPEEITRRTYLLMGDTYAQFDSAQHRVMYRAETWYNSAGIKDHSEKWVRYGDVCLAKGNPDGARKAYKVAGVKLTKEKLIEYGDVLLANRNIGGANNVYAAAGVEIPKEKLVSIGQLCLAEGDFFTAEEAYEAAGVRMPKEKVIECGDVCLAKGHFSNAQGAYERARVKMPREGLIICGDVLLAKNDVNRALVAYTAAGAVERLVAYGDKCLAEGDHRYAEEIYAIAGRKLPKETLIICGDAFLLEGNFNAAMEAYKEAGAKEKLIALGDRFLAHRFISFLRDGDENLSYAKKAYEAAGVEMPKEKLVHFGQMWLAREEFFLAKDAYEAAGVEMPKEKERLLALGQKALWNENERLAQDYFKRVAVLDEDT